MLKNYLKIAVRNLWKHKVFSFINIMGLTVAMTACFLIFLYVSFELSYDSQHTKANRIYRLVTDIKTPTETLNWNSTSWPFAPNLKSEFPEIELFVRTYGTSMLVRNGNVKFKENALLADSSLFNVFDFKLIKGNVQTALKNQFSIVFSETAAKKYFGNADPIGRTLLLTDKSRIATVTGIMKDIPGNSQIRADMLLSMTTLTQNIDPKIDEQCDNFGVTTFLLLKSGTDPKALEAKLPAFIEKYYGKNLKRAQSHFTFFLEPLRGVYLYSTRDGSKNGNIYNVYVFSVIAIFILLIACANFINLTTARSTDRAKEVGIRKVAGAAKKQLAGQFIGESVTVCLIAFLITVVLSILLLPLFNELSGKSISQGIFANLHHLLILFFSAIGIGLMAGIYPALVLSSFKPVAVLKGRFVKSNRGIILRKGLVIAQFTISITLIIGTIVVYNQMNYMRNDDLGFNKDQTMIIPTEGDPAKLAFKKAIADLPAVTSTTMSSSVPGEGNSVAYSEVENNKGALQIANLDLYYIDYDYIKQFNIKILAGRAFSRDFGTDTTQAIILNETAVKMFGYNSPQAAIGKRFKQWGQEGKIIGVVKDFHFRSLQETIKPLTMRINFKESNLISVKLEAGNLPATIASIERNWKTLMPNKPFSYSFLDESFDRQYRAEEKFGKLFLNFAILAIFISCLGLLGLASYSTIQRTKEIGIRKVLGADISSIVIMISKEFLILVLIAVAISFPIAWLVMSQWLEDFAYRITISWWILGGAGCIALSIALLTIGFQTIKVAMASPVKSLRTE